MAASFVCPVCHEVLNVKTVPPPGTLVRCFICKKSFEMPNENYVRKLQAQASIGKELNTPFGCAEDVAFNDSFSAVAPSQQQGSLSNSGPIRPQPEKLIIEPIKPVVLWAMISGGGLGVIVLFGLVCMSIFNSNREDVATAPVIAPPSPPVGKSTPLDTAPGISVSKSAPAASPSMNRPPVVTVPATTPPVRNSPVPSKFPAASPPASTPPRMFSTTYIPGSISPNPKHHPKKHRISEGTMIYLIGKSFQLEFEVKQRTIVSDQSYERVFHPTLTFEGINFDGSELFTRPLRKLSFLMTCNYSEGDSKQFRTCFAAITMMGEIAPRTNNSEKDGSQIVVPVAVFEELPPYMTPATQWTVSRPRHFALDATTAFTATENIQYKVVDESDERTVISKVISGSEEVRPGVTVDIQGSGQVEIDADIHLCRTGKTRWAIKLNDGARSKNYTLESETRLIHVEYCPPAK